MALLDLQSVADGSVIERHRDVTHCTENFVLCLEHHFRDFRNSIDNFHTIVLRLLVIAEKPYLVGLGG